MLQNQPMAYFTTVAETYNPPIKTGLTDSQKYRLGFDQEGKIELFEFELATLNSNAKVTDPNELDLKSLTVTPKAVLSDKELALLFNFVGDEFLGKVNELRQLGLLVSLCKDNHLIPGFSLESDEIILKRLSEALSPNISNPIAVINEFIQLWNKQVCHTPFATYFAYNPNYEEQLKAQSDNFALYAVLNQMNLLKLSPTEYPIEAAVNDMQFLSPLFNEHLQNSARLPIRQHKQSSKLCPQFKLSKNQALVNTEQKAMLKRARACKKAFYN